MTLNFRVISLCVIVFGTLVKVFSLFWIYSIVSCIAIALLSIASVILSSSPQISVKNVSRNPLEQHRVRLGLDCT